MKIVNLEAFRLLPPGTLYSKYKPCTFDGLMIKGQTWEHDFIYQDLIGNIECTDSGDFCNKLDEALENSKSLGLDFDCMSRDGLFDEDQLFAIYEDEDVKGLIKRIQNY